MNHLISELSRRNVPRAGLLYAGAVWALAQGISQLGPSVGAPEWVTRWFLVGAAVGFPFWLAFAWFYEFTRDGLRRESEIDPADPVAHATGRKLDFWIIGVLALAVVLLLTNQFVLRGEATGAASAQAVADRLATVPVKSIAVLPLANASGDQDQVYFSDGLSEDLINALSQFDGLKVIGRNSSFQFRDSQGDARTIGARLGVAHLLEGSVRRAGDTVRITAQLVRVADGSTLWSEQYDRPFQDLFSLQDEITRKVANALKTQLLPGAGTSAQSERPPSGNLAAYTALLQGRQYSRVATSEASHRKALDAYIEATRIDPGYALAYANQAISWINISALRTGTARQQAIAQARAAANTALSVDPESGAGYSAIAMVQSYVDRDWAGAEASFRRDMRLNPGSASIKMNLGSLLLKTSRPGEAADLLQQGLEIDPLDARKYYLLGATLTMLGRLDEAEQAAQTIIEMAPERATLARNLMLAIEILRRDSAAALAQANQGGEDGDDVFRKVNVALALQVGPDRAAADAALQAVIDAQADTMAYQIAEAYALREDADNMFKWLDHAHATHDGGLESLLSDPFLKPYWHDPRFAVLARKVGLPVPDAAAHA